MAIIFTDGFESGNHNNWDYEDSAEVISSGGLSMSGDYCLDIKGNVEYLAKDISAVNEMYFSFLYRPYAENSVQVFSVWDSTTWKICLNRAASTDIIILYRGPTQIDTGTITLTVGSTYLIELWCLIHDTSGRVVVKVDGVTDIDFSGDTLFLTGDTFNIVRLGYNEHTSSYPGGYFDNFGMDDTNWLGGDFITTAAPTTTVPTTLGSTTAAPTSLASTTLSPTTIAPTTIAPTSSAPTTVITTASPTTLGPTTQTPTSLAPTSLVSTTLTPTTVLTTAAPTTLAPTTVAPTTVAPTTLAPTTAVPTTSTPTTIAPTTMAPTTVASTTSAPVTTPVPTTLAPTTMGPTSLAPTTLVPTTSGSTTIAPTSLAPTTTLTTSVPTTPPPHNVDNDTIFNCKANNFAGYLFVETSIDGVSLNASYGLADLELFVETSITGGVPCAGLYVLDDLELFVDTSIEGWGVANDQKKNWVGWSKIGEANFALDLTNDAGFRPMDWPGYVYQVRKLDKNVIIYGSGGVTAAYPVDSPMPTFGFKNMINVGVKNKTAVCGDEHIHFCIDILGCLYKISTDGITRLGYEEFLLPLINPTMTWDVAKRRLYIGDESTGYVYNEDILTGGYAKLTGLYRVKENLIAVSPDTLITEPVEICTDIIDFKRRGLKSIESMQFDAISEVPLFAAIDYRYRKKDEFRTTQWSQLNNEGVAHVRTAGVEFRIRLKGLDHGTFDFSYISVQFKFIDQRFTRDPKGELDVY